MQVKKLVVTVAVLAVGPVARAESIVPCNFVDDFCVAPSDPGRGAVAAVATSELGATARSFIPGNFVDDFGVEAESAESQATQRAAPTARSFIPGNFVDDFGVEAESAPSP